MGKKMLVTVLAMLMYSYSDGRTINGHDDLDVPTKGNYQQRSLGMAIDNMKFQTKDEPPRINEQRTGDHQRYMENNRFVPLRTMKQSNVDSPKKKGVHELLNKMDQEKDGPPRVTEEERDEPPRVTEEERDEPPRVTEEERDGPPRVTEEERDEPPRVTEEERDEPPRVTEEERDEPPRVTEEERDEPPRVTEEARDGPPRVSEEERDEPPRVTEEERDEPTRVAEEERDEPPRVTEEERDEPPRVTEEERDEPPRVAEEERDGSPRVSEEETDEPPRLMDKDGSTGIVGNIFDMDKEYSIYKPRFPTPDEQVQLSDPSPKYNDVPDKKQGLRISKRDANSRLLKRSSKYYEQVLENTEDKYQALDELDKSMTEELNPTGDNVEQKDQCVRPKLRFCGEFIDYPIAKAQMSMHSFYDGLVEAGMDLLTITSKGAIRSCQKELKKVFCRDRFPKCRKGHVYWHGLQDACSKVIEKCPAKLQDELRNLNMCRKLNEGKSPITNCVSPIRTTETGACKLSAADKVSPWDRHSAIEVNNLLQMQKELFFPSEACMKSLSSYLCYPGKTCSGLEDAVALASNYKARCKKVLSSCNRMVLSKGMKMFFDCR